MIRKGRVNLIDENGKYNYGKYSERILKLNPLDLKTGLWGYLPPALKKKRLKEWHAYMIGAKDYYILVGAMDLKLFSIIRIMVYDKNRNHTWGLSDVLPLKNVKMSKNLSDDSMYLQEGNTTIYANHCLDSNKIEMGFSFVDELSGEKLAGYFRTGDSMNEPQVSVLPMKNGAGLYTHKQLMAFEGCMNIGEEVHVLTQQETSLVLDDQKVYYPYKTEWDWITASGIVGDDYCGFTVSDVKGIKSGYNENGFWKNGKIHEVPDVKFCRNIASGTWTIVDEKGMVNILFKPVAKHMLKRNFGLVAGAYEGPFGWFSGHLSSLDGETLHINGMFGMGEKMNLRL